MENIGSPGDREMIFETDIPLEEDIVAELEEFILLGRLGIVDEAVQLLQNVLWRHLRFFPVLAEAAAFLLEHELWAQFQALLEELDLRKIQFEDHDEVDFIDVLHVLHSIVKEDRLPKNFTSERLDFLKKQNGEIYHSPLQVSAPLFLIPWLTRTSDAKDRNTCVHRNKGS